MEKHRDSTRVDFSRSLYPPNPSDEGKTIDNQVPESLHILRLLSGGHPESNSADDECNVVISVTPPPRPY